MYLFFFSLLLKAYSPVNRTWSPQGFIIIKNSNNNNRPTNNNDDNDDYSGLFTSLQSAALLEVLKP